MVEVDVNCGFRWMADQCEKYIGPRKFYLHNRIGGHGWDVRQSAIEVNGMMIQGTKARFDDPKTATFIMLKI